MTQKRIFVLNGHPGPHSLSKHFAETYQKAAADAGHDVRITHLHDLAFDMDFGQAAYEDPKPIEPQIQVVLDNIKWAEHVVLTTPMWWGGLPAKLKGLFDRILLPGIAFDPRNPNIFGLPKPLLTGKTGRAIITSDSPGLYLRFAHGNAMLRQIKGQIFGFVGIKPTRFCHFATASHPKPGVVERWTTKVAQIGSDGV